MTEETQDNQIEESANPADIFKNALIDITSVEIPHQETADSNEDIKKDEDDISSTEADQPEETVDGPVVVTEPPVVETFVEPAPVAIEEPVVDQSLPNICADDQLQNDRLNAALATLINPVQLPGPTIAAANQAFYAVVSYYLVRKPKNEFNPFFTKLLDFVNTHLEGRFESKRRYEAHELITGLSKAQLHEYGAIVNILAELAPTASRLKNARSINWQAVQNSFQHVHSEFVTNRLKDFFNVN